MNYSAQLEFAQEMDEQDELRHFRKQFHIPKQADKEVIYFTGNSLGLQPKSTAAHVEQELKDWAELGVEGHFHAQNPWLPYHERFPAQLSGIIGCLPHEVVVMNQLTVNLHLLMISFYRPTSRKYKIICEARAFPSDQYAMESQVRMHGFDPTDSIIEVLPRQGEHTLRTEDIIATIHQHRNELALVLFGGVNYYSGQLFDMKAITEETHRVGALAGFDLAHAIGNVELRMHDWKVDFACWCSYKYLNSGPGGVAGIYIHESHVVNKDIPRLAGWWGYEKETRFQMQKGFEPIPTAEGWQLSNAPVLSMAAHKAALDIFEQAGMEALVRKGKQLSGYLIFLIGKLNERTGNNTIELITPADENLRGCQVSMLMHKRGKEIFSELLNQGVIADWREPNVIRVAPVPLYNRFEEVWRFVEIIKKLIS